MKFPRLFLTGTALVLCFLSLFEPSTARNEEYNDLTLREVRRNCKNWQNTSDLPPSEALRVGLCMGTFYGIGLVMESNCMDNDYDGYWKIMHTDIDQQISAFLNWMSKNPALWDEHAIMILNILVEELPCPR